MDWTQKCFLELVTVTHRSHHQMTKSVYRIYCSINTQIFGQQYRLMTSKCDTPAGVTFRIMTFDLRCTFTPETTIDLITSDHMKLLFSVVSVILLCLNPPADTDLLSNLLFLSWYYIAYLLLGYGTEFLWSKLFLYNCMKGYIFLFSVKNCCNFLPVIV